jgi:hypothetical protein
MKRSIVIRFGIAAAGLALLTSCADTPGPTPILPPPVAEAAPPPVEVAKVSVAVRPPPLPMAARRHPVTAVAASAPPPRVVHVAKVRPARFVYRHPRRFVRVARFHPVAPPSCGSSDHPCNIEHVESPVR